MRIFVKTRPGAGAEKVDKVDNTHYIVWVREAPEHGQANKAVIRALAEYLGKPKALLTIKSGHTSSAKVIEIL